MIKFLKSHNTIYLLVFSAFSIMLVLFRAWIIKDATFLFLIKNLALAWIPYFVSYFFKVEKIRGWYLFLLIFFWLLFFPNTLYLVTDLFQLWPRNFVSVWFDLILLFSFALIGLLLAFGGLKNFEERMAKVYGKKKASVFCFLVLFLGSHGVYLGRFKRLNSSDIFIQPSHLFKEIFDVAAHPFEDVNFYATTFVFTLFTYLFYYGVFHFAKSH